MRSPRCARLQRQSARAAAAALVADVRTAHDEVVERGRRLVSGTRSRLRESGLAVAAKGSGVSAHGHRALDRAEVHVHTMARYTVVGARGALDDGLRAARAGAGRSTVPEALEAAGRDASATGGRRGNG